jgi:hypothetical protein
VCVHTQYANMPASTLLQLNVAIESSYLGGSRLKSQHGDHTTEVLMFTSVFKTKLEKLQSIRPRPVYFKPFANGTNIRCCLA